MLIAARVVTGTGAALLLPPSLAIVRVVWPEQATRRRVLGVWASCNGLAFVVGPTIGGGLTEHFGWPSAFLLSVPLALVALAIARPDHPRVSPTRQTATWTCPANSPARRCLGA